MGEGLILRQAPRRSDSSERMAEDPETRNLIDRARKGEREAIEELFARIYPDLLQAVRFRLGPTLRERLDSLDIAQSVYLEAYRDLGDFNGRLVPRVGPENSREQNSRPRRLSPGSKERSQLASQLV